MYLIIKFIDKKFKLICVIIIYKSSKSMALRKDLLAATLVTLVTAGALFFLEPSTYEQNLTVGCISRDNIVKRGQ